MRNTRRLPHSALRLTAAILAVTLFVAIGSELAAQGVAKGNRAGFASSSKTQYIKSNEFSIDAELAVGDPNSVLDVRIVGNDQIRATDIKKILKTRNGRPYSEAVLEEDKRALMQKGWFVDVKPRVEKMPNGYIVTFVFIERPILHYVKIVGNRVHTRKVLLEEANLKPGDALDPIAVHQAKERIIQFYRDGGHYRVNVEVMSGDTIGDRGAVFLISEGIKQRPLSVEFEGNHIASSARLKTLIQSKPGWFFWINGEFTRKKLDEDLETLTTYYRNLGFFYAKIDADFEETEGGYTGAGKNRVWVKIKFIIDEGPRCRVRDIRFVGNRVFDKDTLLKTMKLPKEKYFNQDMLEADMARIKEKYGNDGFVFSQTVPDPRIDEDYVDLVINVKEGPRCYLRTLGIEIVGNEGADPYTKWHPILNRSTLRPGEVLRTKEINDSRRRLMASQLFNANPTQGAIPEFIFEMDDATKELIEADETERVAEENTKIRGQVQHQTDRPIFQNESTENEAELERLSEFFRIRPRAAQPQPVQEVPVYQPQPAAPVQPYQPQNRPQPYLPIQQPVQPMKLGWKEPGPDALEIRREDGVVRGQTFTLPTTSSPSPKVTQSYTPPNFATGTYVNQNANLSAPMPVSVGTFSPVQQTASTWSGQAGSLSPTSTHLSQHQSEYNRGYATQLQTSQPANVSYPVTSTGPYGTTYQTPTSTQAPQGTVPYKPPTDITPQAYRPEAYLSPPSGGQQVGNNVLYNSGMVFTQHTVPNTPQQVVLGNPYSSLGENTTVRIDPNAPPGVSNKIYPADGRWIVQETRTGQLMMSVAVSSDSGLMGRFVIEEQNFDILNLPKGWRLSDWKNAFRGKGQRFRIEAVPGTEVQRYSVSWETPYLFDLDYSFGVSGFYYERYYDEWYEDRVGGSISFGKLWTPDFSTRLSLGAQQVSIYRPMMNAEDLYAVLGHHPMYTIGLEASHNTRDSEYMPTEGHLLSLHVEQVLGDYQFVRGGYDFRKYFMLRERPDRSGRWVLGLRSSMSISEKGTPIYERYFGGGFTSMRGFEYRGVSPRDKEGNILGGCLEFYNSAELVFPITADDMIKGSFFVDTGTVEKSISKWESNYRVALGFGLRLTIPMMGPAPIAIDFAFPVSKQSGDEKQVFSFNVGFMR